MKLNHPCLLFLVGFAVIALCACANPVAETYQKGIDGGEKAIDKARNVQQTTDQTKINIEQQAKDAEASPKSP
ncbi:MAG: hypothetical protein WCA35_18225 [Kovacikia sp.]